MKQICVIDGQGGGIGRTIVKKLKTQFEETVEIIALGTNAIATANMIKAKANRGASGDCPADYLPYLVENEVTTGVCTPCAKNRELDEAKFFSNMMLDGGPHLIDMAAEAKVFNF